LLVVVGDLGAAARGLWPLEIVNVLRSAERRGRTSLAEQSPVLAILGELPIHLDQQTAALASGPISALAAGETSLFMTPAIWSWPCVLACRSLRSTSACVRPRLPRVFG
jgi:hypothetical protein